MEQFKFFMAGAFLAMVGGAGLDAEGKDYVISLTLLAIGLFVMALNLILNYRDAKRIQANRIKRAMERERRNA